LVIVLNLFFIGCGLVVEKSHLGVPEDLSNKSFRLLTYRPSDEARARVADIMQKQKSVELLGFGQDSVLAALHFVARENEFVDLRLFLLAKILNVGVFCCLRLSESNLTRMLRDLTGSGDNLKAALDICGANAEKWKPLPKTAPETAAARELENNKRANGRCRAIRDALVFWTLHLQNDPTAHTKPTKKGLLFSKRLVYCWSSNQSLCVVNICECSRLSNQVYSGGFLFKKPGLCMVAYSVFLQPYSNFTRT
jgi:hypothetical protein